ncbi:MAG TPA: hypothetical protein VG405_06310, partial [Solirubrobacteraceae bacterium]|nr:hypothetical protein [Solirubrobacteraceae bacterium]
ADPCDGGAAGCPASSTMTTTPTTETTSTTTTATSADPTVVAGDASLKRVVPSILRSRAYTKSGALMILFSATGGSAQAGATTGALLLSPFVKAGSTERRVTNIYGALRTLDKVFGLAPLGMARQARPIQLIPR